MSLSMWLSVLSMAAAACLALAPLAVTLLRGHHDRD